MSTLRSTEVSLRPARSPALDQSERVAQTALHRLVAGACIAGVLFTYAGAASGAAKRVRPTVVASYPHDARAFTQGLLLHEGVFYESTGLYGRSSLREVVPATGEVIRRVDLGKELFGEGLALVHDRLIQLTWKNNTALVYDQKSFKRTAGFDYDGEGWGLCFDGSRLVMSDGSSTLSFRDPATFKRLSQVQVMLDGQPVSQLNELECVGKLVYANVWQTTDIMRIDPTTGRVLTVVDAAALAQEQPAADVLNGIAYDPGTQHFWITGKLWSKVYETKFSFSPDGEKTDTGQNSATADATAPRESIPTPESKPLPHSSRSPKVSAGACDCALSLRVPSGYWATLGWLGLLVMRRIR